jgi:hypothetical protein
MSESKELKIVNEKGGTLMHRHSRSIFFPILLIGGGTLLLLTNMGMLSGLNWAAVAPLWPLLIIFIGLDVIVRQVSPPGGALLSGLVALVAVALFGYVLFSGNMLFRFGNASTTTELHMETFNLPAEGIQSADVTLDLGNARAEINALQDSNDLIAGTIFTSGDLVFHTDVKNGEANVVVGEENVVGLFNPANWFRNDPEHTWQFGLGSNVPTELHVDVGNGSATAALDQLTLTGLQIDGGNGSLDAALPAGDYDIEVDSGNGSMDLTLPSGGEQTMRLDGGNGSIDLLLPANVEAQIRYNEGLGSVNVDEGRFTRVSGDDEEGVYETAGYASAADRITINLESGNGSISVSGR